MKVFLVELSKNSKPNGIFCRLWKKQSSTLRHIHFRSLAPLFLSPCQCWSFFLIGNSNFFDLLSKTNFKGNVEWRLCCFSLKAPKKCLFCFKGWTFRAWISWPKNSIKRYKNRNINGTINGIIPWDRFYFHSFCFC